MFVFRYHYNSTLYLWSSLDNVVHFPHSRHKWLNVIHEEVYSIYKVFFLDGNEILGSTELQKVQLLEFVLITHYLLFLLKTKIF